MNCSVRRSRPALRFLPCAVNLSPRRLRTAAGPPQVLVRDFIHDSLYSRAVGYFERNVNILKPCPGKDIQFEKLKDENDYNNTVRKIYDDNISQHGNSWRREVAAPGDGSKSTAERDLYQLWHTPSTLFRPHYGRAIANCILRKWDGKAPIIIYEVGPGNGSLCEDIMLHFQQEIPSHIDKVEYHLIEISKYQADNILVNLLNKFPKNIRIHNISFLQWSIVERRKVFVLAMEVFDNLTHDVIRLIKNRRDGVIDIQQCMVVERHAFVEEFGQPSVQVKYEEVFIPVSDPLILELTECMDHIGHNWYYHKGKNELWNMALNAWPLSELNLAGNKEFIPSGSFQFMKILLSKFPNHCFVMSDFDYLPPTVSGFNGPVVQTRYKGKTVGSSTYLLQKGLCDIFFPTDFNLLAEMYKLLHLKAMSHRASILYSECTISDKDGCGFDISVLKHRDFCLEFADHKLTQTISGYNPMLDDFSNVSFLIGETESFNS